MQAFCQCAQAFCQRVDARDGFAKACDDGKSRMISDGVIPSEI
jgi:hypothetical protein